MRRKARVSEKVYTYLCAVFGDDAAKQYWAFVKKPPTKYLRVNELKISRTDLANRLYDNYGIATEELEFPTNALKVTGGYEFVGTTLELVFGLYYIQGVSSMFPPIVLNPSVTDTVLDLCSAPGSKTTQLAELMKNKGKLVVNEVQIDRIKALVFNLDKMNFLNYGVLNSKGEILSKFYDAAFDKILVDAPCSGLGIIQKKNEVNKWWSLERVARLTDLQTRLMVTAIKMLKVGGEIVYSTCTLTPEENELVINNLLRNYPLEIQDIDLPYQHKEGFTRYHGIDLNQNLAKAIRIVPWEADSDGFFMVKLRKTGETTPPEQEKKRRSYVMTFHKPDDKEIKDYLKLISDEFGIKKKVLSEYNYMLKRKEIFFVSGDWTDENLGLFHRIGTKFGTIDKNNRIVLHSHAAQVFEKDITKNIYEITDLDELKTYITGGLILNDSIEPGQYAVKYEGVIMGTGVVIQGGLKSRFPRSKRTQKIRVKDITI